MCYILLSSLVKLKATVTFRNQYSFIKIRINFTFCINCRWKPGVTVKTGVEYRNGILRHWKKNLRNILYHAG